MITGEFLLDTLLSLGCRFFTGVPDSVLGGFASACGRVSAPARNVVAANEGNAIALASGWWFARGEPGVVYLQNAGLGNAINPPQIEGQIEGAIAQSVGWTTQENFVQRDGRVLTDQLRVAEQNLRRAEQKLSEYKSQNRVVRPEKQAENALEQITKLESGIALSEADLEQSRRKAQVLQAQLQSQTEALGSGTLLNFDVISELRKQLTNVEVEILTAEQKYTDKYPGVLPALRAQRDELKRRLEAEVTSIVQSKAGSPEKQSGLADAYAAAEVESVGLAARVTVQKDMLREVNRKLYELQFPEEEMFQ